MHSRAPRGPYSAPHSLPDIIPRGAGTVGVASPLVAGVLEWRTPGLKIPSEEPLGLRVEPRTHSCSGPWPSVPDAGTWGLDAWGEVRKAGWLLLTSYHIYSMVKCMKTTLNIDSTVMQRLRQEAARQGRTMSDIVESALRLFFKSTRERRPLPDLPSFDSGGSLVDIADREALYGAMEGR